MAPLVKRAHMVSGDLPVHCDATSIALVRAIAVPEHVTGATLITCGDLIVRINVKRSVLTAIKQERASIVLMDFGATDAKTCVTSRA